MSKGIGSTQRRPLHEAVVVAMAVIAAVALSMGIFARRATLSGERLLIHELGVLRNASMLYCALNRAPAPDLSGVLAGSFNGGDKGALPYIPERAFGETSHMRDPFGNPYVYDQVTGWVSSRTTGYEIW